MAVDTTSTINKSIRIASPAPDTALTDAAGLYIMNRTDNIQRSPIEFTTPNLSGTITKVELFLYCVDVGAGNTGHAHNLHQMTRSNWTQAGGTWNKYDGTNAWTTAGGDFSATVVDSIAEATSTGWKSWVIYGTGADNPVTINWNTTYDFILKSANESGSWGNEYARIFNGISAASNKPYVQITYDATNNYTLALAQGTFTLTGQASLFHLAYKVVAALGTFTLTGVATAFSLGKGILASVGNFALTGRDTNLTSVRTMLAAAGSYTLTGIETTFRKGGYLIASAGNYALTGVNVVVSSARTMAAAKGTFTLTGQAVSIGLARMVAAARGVFTFSGSAVRFLLNGVEAKWHFINSKHNSSWTNRNKS